MPGLNDEDLHDLLFRAVAAGDRFLTQAVVAEAVSRYAGIEPGRVVAGMYYLYRTLTRLDLDTLPERLRQAAGPGGQGELGPQARRGRLPEPGR